MDNAALLADAGFTAIWLPPAYKGQAGVNDIGYGVYDTYDLGEFDQKGAVPTKYGTKDEYLAAVAALKAAGIDVMADVVLNHRMGANASEDVLALKVDPANRYPDPARSSRDSAPPFPRASGASRTPTTDRKSVV